MATDPEKKRREEQRRRLRRERDRAAARAAERRRREADAARAERVRAREGTGQGPSLGRRAITTLSDAILGPDPTPALRREDFGAPPEIPGLPGARPIDQPGLREMLGIQEGAPSMEELSTQERIAQAIAESGAPGRVFPAPPPAGPTVAGLERFEQARRLQERPLRTPPEEPSLIDHALTAIPQLAGAGLRAIADPAGSYLGATPDQQRAISDWLYERGEDLRLRGPLANPLEAVVDRLAPDLTPEERARFGVAVAEMSGVPGAGRIAAALSEGLSRITPEPVKEVTRETLRSQGKAMAQLSGALGPDFLKRGAAAMAKELHAASGYDEGDLAPYFPGGRVPETSTGDHFLAELFDPLTYVPGGIARSALLNALSSAARPFGYEDESTALERALLGAAATPAVAAGLRGAGRTLGATAGGAGRLASAVAEPALPAAEQAIRLARDAVGRGARALEGATARVETERQAYRTAQGLVDIANLARERGRGDLADEILRATGSGLATVERTSGLDRALAGIRGAAGPTAVATSAIFGVPEVLGGPEDVEVVDRGVEAVLSATALLGLAAARRLDNEQVSGLLGYINTRLSRLSGDKLDDYLRARAALETVAAERGIPVPEVGGPAPSGQARIPAHLSPVVRPGDRTRLGSTPGGPRPGEDSITHLKNLLAHPEQNFSGFWVAEELGKLDARGLRELLGPARERLDAARGIRGGWKWWRAAQGYTELIEELRRRLGVTFGYIDGRHPATRDEFEQVIEEGLRRLEAGQGGAGLLGVAGLGAAGLGAATLAGGDEGETTLAMGPAVMDAIRGRVSPRSLSLRELNDLIRVLRTTPRGTERYRDLYRRALAARALKIQERDARAPERVLQIAIVRLEDGKFTEERVVGREGDEVITASGRRVPADRMVEVTLPPAIAAMGAAGVAAAALGEEGREAGEFTALAATLGALGVAPRPNFYSRLRRRIEEGPRRGTVQQWVRHLQTGTARAEREWTGVEALLENLDRTAMLTRDEVMEVFQRGEIRVGRTVRGGSDPRIDQLWARSDELREALGEARRELEDVMREAGYSDETIRSTVDFPRFRMPAPVPLALKAERREARLSLLDALQREDNLGFESADDAAQAILSIRDPAEVARVFDISPALMARVERYLAASNAVLEAGRQPAPEAVRRAVARLRELREQNDAIVRQVRQIREGQPSTHYGKWYDQGGEDYAESLLTLESESPALAEARRLQDELQEAFDEGARLLDELEGSPEGDTSGRLAAARERVQAAERALKDFMSRQPQALHDLLEATRGLEQASERAARLEAELMQFMEAHNVPEPIRARALEGNQLTLAAHPRWASLPEPVRARISDLSQRAARASTTALQWDTRARQARLGLSFSGPHWDERNVIAHARTKRYTDSEGRRVHDIGELQSDWAQQGREKGFVSDPLDTTGWTAREGDGDPASGPVWEVRDETGYWILGVPRSSVSSPEEAIRRAALRSNRSEAGNRVPDMPFKKTEDWVQLALKAEIERAIDDGAEVVTFTTGRQAADLYDLSKQISRVDYIERTRTLRAYDRRGNTVLMEDGVAPEKVRDYIGKEAAEKLLAQEPDQGWRVLPVSEYDRLYPENAFDYGPGRPRWVVADHDGAIFSTYADEAAALADVARARTNEPREPVRSLSGLDLVVGGEGMRKFYDEIVPSALRKYAKQMGVDLKLEDIHLPEAGLTRRGFVIPDELRHKVQDEGQPLLSVGALIGGGLTASAFIDRSNLETEEDQRVAKALLGLLGLPKKGRLRGRLPFKIDEIRDPGLRALFKSGRWNIDIGPAVERYGERRLEVRYNPIPTGGVVEVPGGRLGSRFYDKDLATLDGEGRVVLREDSGYLPEIPAQPEEGYIYRGMSYDEWLASIERGYLLSDGGYNLAGQEGFTFFASDPTTAASYVGGFSPYPFTPTFDRPGIVVKVRRPANAIEGGVGDPRVSPGEVAVEGRIPIREVVSVYEGRPYEIRGGWIELYSDYGRPYQQGSAGHAVAHLAWREIPLGETGGEAAASLAAAVRPRIVAESMPSPAIADQRVPGIMSAPAEVRDAYSAERFNLVVRAADEALERLGLPKPEITWSAGTYLSEANRIASIRVKQISDDPVVQDAYENLISSLYGFLGEQNAVVRMRLVDVPSEGVAARFLDLKGDDLTRALEEVGLGGTDGAVIFYLNRDLTTAELDAVARAIWRASDEAGLQDLGATKIGNALAFGNFTKYTDKELSDREFADILIGVVERLPDEIRRAFTGDFDIGRTRGAYLGDDWGGTQGEHWNKLFRDSLEQLREKGYLPKGSLEGQGADARIASVFGDLYRRVQDGFAAVDTRFRSQTGGTGGAAGTGGPGGVTAALAGALLAGGGAAGALGGEGEEGLAVSSLPLFGGRLTAAAAGRLPFRRGRGTLARTLGHRLGRRLPMRRGEGALQQLRGPEQRALADAIMAGHLPDLVGPGTSRADVEAFLRRLAPTELDNLLDQAFPQLRRGVSPEELRAQGYPFGQEYPIRMPRVEDLIYDSPKSGGANPGAVFVDPYSGRQVMAKASSVLQNPEAETFVDRLERELFHGLFPSKESTVLYGDEALQLAELEPPALRRTFRTGDTFQEAAREGVYLRPYLPIRAQKAPRTSHHTEAQAVDALRAGLLGHTVLNPDLHGQNVVPFEGGRLGAIDAGLALVDAYYSPLTDIGEPTANALRALIRGSVAGQEVPAYASVDPVRALRPMAERVRGLDSVEIGRLVDDAYDAISRWQDLGRDLEPDEVAYHFETRLRTLPDVAEEIIAAARHARQYPAGDPARTTTYRNLIRDIREIAPVIAALGVAGSLFTPEETRDLEHAGFWALIGSALPKRARNVFRRQIKAIAETDADRVLSRIDYSPRRRGLGEADLPYEALRAYTYSLDRLAPIGRATTEFARETGAMERKGFLSRLLSGPELGRERIPLAADAETLARAAEGWQGYAAEVLDRGIHIPGDPLHSRTRGLNQILADVGSLPDVRLEHATYTAAHALDAYRAAKRAIELADPARPAGGRETGFDLGSAHRLVEQIEAGYPEIVRLQRELVQYHDEWVRLLEEEGVLRPGALDEMKAAGNNEYMPFFRTGHEDGRRGPTVGGKRLGDLPDPVKRLLGSERKVVPPSESDIRMTYAYANLLMRQRASNALAEIAELWKDNPWIRRVRRPTRKIAFAKEQLKGQIDDTLLDMIDEDFLSVFTGTRPRAGSHTISVTREGKRVFYQLDPLLYESVMGLSPRQMSFLERLLAAPASWLRTGVTIMPDFALANLIRDTMQVAATDSRGPVVMAMANAVGGMLRGLATLMAGAEPRAGMRTLKAAAPGALFGALAPAGIEEDEARIRGLSALGGAALTGAFGALSPQIARGVTRRARGRPSSRQAPEDLIAAWRSAGGDFAAHLSMDRDALASSIREAQRSGKRFPVAWTPAEALRALRAANEVVENANRMGEFLRSIDAAGRLDVESATRGAVSSRDISVDFKRAGLSRLTEILRPLAAFWNARIQGVDKIVRAFQRDPRRTGAVLMTSLTLPSLGLWYINRDNPDYWELPLWQRNLFWMVPIGTETLEDGSTQTVFLRIPKPFELGIFFASLPERMVEAFDPNNPHRGGSAQIEDEAWTQFLGEVAGMFSPLPTAAQPWLEMFMNRNLFTGRTIHSVFEPEDMDPRLKGRARATEAAKLFSDALGATADAMSGVPIARQMADWLRLSPAEIDHVLYSYLGGGGRLAMRGADMALRDTEARGPAPAGQIGEMPFTGRFLARVPPPTAESVAQVGDLWRQAQGLEATINRWMEAGEVERAMEAMERQPELYAAYGTLKEAADYLRTQREFEREIENNPDLSADEKRRMLDVIYKESARVAQETLELLRMQREELKQIGGAR